VVVIVSVADASPGMKVYHLASPPLDIPRELKMAAKVVSEPLFEKVPEVEDVRMASAPAIVVPPPPAETPMMSKGTKANAAFIAKNCRGRKWIHWTNSRFNDHCRRFGDRDGR
jgi:hypothetical protein